MLTLIAGAGWVAVALAAVGAAYALVAAALLRRFLRRPSPRGDSAAVSLLKPLHGAELGLEEALRSFCEQDYAAPRQLLLGVQDAADPAVDVVRQLQRTYPALDIELVIDPRQHGANRKISNVINLAARAKHPVLVLSDSDIRVPRDYLAVVTGALGQDGVGAVTCLYAGEAAGGLWSQLAAMAISCHFLPNAVLGFTLGLEKPCFGSTIALGTDMLREIGGFEAFAGHLADDYEIGRAVRATGQRIAIPPMILAHRCSEASGGELLEHELRWGLTIRRINGAGYAGSVVTHPMPLALAGLALTGLAPGAWAVLAAALAARLTLKLQVDAATKAPGGRWWLLPMRDMLSFGVFVASFLVSSVAWRGRRFRVGPDGLITPS